MHEDDVVRIVRSHVEGLFPRTCSSCGRRFGSLREYLRSTTHVGTPILYQPLSEQDPAEPLGPVAYANCTCGTTLSIGSEGIPRGQMAELLKWAGTTCEQRGIEMNELLRHVRDRVDAEVLRGDGDLG